MLEMTDDGVEEMLALAERLRQNNAGELDESAILAVAEATGAPLEYVRLAVKLRAEKERSNIFATIRAQFLLLGASTRRYVYSGLCAVAAALLSVVGSWVDQMTQIVNSSQYAVLGMFSLAFLAIGVYNVSLARDMRTSATAGAIFGGGFYLVSALC
jgi:hypothetical protein